VALLPNGTAGITVFDVYWDPERGYRAVYFSFEVEATVSESGKLLLQQAIEWASRWKYPDITELLKGKIRVPKEAAKTFKELIRDTKGETLYDDPILLPEEGNYNLTINVDKPGNITVIIVHPWSGKVNITVIGESVKEVNISKHNNITQVDVYVERSGSITMYLTSDPTSTFDQAYVYASTIEAEEAITTVTTIVTTSVTTTTTVTIPITVPTTITKTETKMIKETETTTLTKTRTRTHYIART